MNFRQLSGVYGSLQHTHALIFTCTHTTLHHVFQEHTIFYCASDLVWPGHGLTYFDVAWYGVSVRTLLA